VLGGATGITYSAQVLALKNPDGTLVSAAAFTKTTGTMPAAFVTNVAFAQTAGLWLPSAPVVATLADAENIAVVWEGCGATALLASVGMKSGAVGNQKSDWSAVGAETWGLPNP